MANVSYFASNPRTPAQQALYQRILVERSPDAGGAPNGTWTQQTNMAIDTGDEYTAYLDTTANSTDWYRHRWADTGLTGYSDYTDQIQAGDSLVRQWVKLDMPDADLADNVRWNAWIAQTLIDLYAMQVWKYASAALVPVKTNGTDIDTLYAAPSLLRDVIGIEKLDTTSFGNHVAWLDGSEWQQVGRQIRLPYASTSNNYRVWGTTPFQSIGELTDDYFMLAYWMIRKKYLAYRENERANYRKFIVMDRISDISPEQIRMMKQDASAEIETRVRALAFPQPPIPMSTGAWL